MAESQVAGGSIGHVLVTGGCGFLGHHIVRLLRLRDPESRISVLDLNTNRNILAAEGIKYYNGDISSRESIEGVFAKLEYGKVDVVIHTISPPFHLGKELQWSVNVEGTKNLLEVAKGAGVKAFVYTSSASVIMDNSMVLVNADERWPIMVDNDQPEYYSTTKVIQFQMETAYAEHAVLEANRNPEGFLTAAIRPAAIFGEGDVQLIPPMMHASRAGQSKVQIGDNTNLFDYTYVGNVAHAHLLAASALLRTRAMATAPLDNEKVDGEAFFITNDQPVYFWDFPRMLWKETGDVRTAKEIWVLSYSMAWFIGLLMETVMWILGKTPKLTRQQVLKSTMTRFFNIDKAKRRLKYRPVVSLDDGIRRAAKWWLEQEALEQQKKSQ
ncbi:C-3 sterol dehydrogenase/C-4 decarboxylase-like protein [Eremomyces bilateralis CBS 781.70]|uniref:Sterol-4-alpha-carboxylate 3-dehydrogenase ERG26, decarboxylating n=1 Tax=Eremomyces bilateralis CBS 781.70 TaxID=1392243 RepID=A0A6G1FT95_9PEZI|nr:C-3 sterol dehydrogenase/C-4 decarboxylase-like protein [Eremomyces bilateralis CBS 781.70]KAF1808956.1 C-3 sterol dehydrogenase/C-4 decarboxylase-like protein [Eremomyces bilateralis CBS 781.70]